MDTELEAELRKDWECECVKLKCKEKAAKQYFIYTVVFAVTGTLVSFLDPQDFVTALQLQAKGRPRDIAVGLLVVVVTAFSSYLNVLLELQELKEHGEEKGYR